MADKKISQLTALSAANLAPSTDVLAIVDTSATETKKIVAQDLINGVLNVASAVGIGTASPGYRLHVVDNSTGTQVRVASSSSGGTSQSFINTATNGRSYRIGSNFVTGTGEFALYDDTAAAARLTVDSSGNLGIGITSPGAKLEVSGGGGVIVSDSSLTSSQVVLGVGTLTAGRPFVGTNTNTNPLEVGTRAAQALVLVTDSTERARITSDGNLLVGGTSQSGTANREAVFSANKFGLAIIDTTAQTTGVGGALNLGGNYRSAGDAQAFVRIEAAKENATDGNYAYAMAFSTTPNGGTFTERGRFTAGGDFVVGKTSASIGTAGGYVTALGEAVFTVAANPVLYVNRLTDDGDLVRFYQADTQEGSISVSGNTVSYNAFAGSHWSQLQDGSRPDILRGTVMESINELCEWPGEQNERLPKSKVSDTAGSKKVYGVFMAWDNDWTETNDMYVTAVGAFICRVNGSVTVQEGDLLESNGDGTARVQADDIIRSSTIGKVTSTVKTHQYDDGSYCVPTVLYCG